MKKLFKFVQTILLIFSVIIFYNACQDESEPTQSESQVQNIILSSNYGNISDLIYIDLNTNEVLNLTNGIGKNSNPEFSPSGDQIVFSSNRDGNNEIYIYNFTEDEFRNLTNNLAQDFFPKFSPDGSKIIFQSNRDGDADCYLMNLDGSDIINISNNEVEDIYSHFHPDGTKILFESISLGSFYVYVTDLFESNPLNLTSNLHTSRKPVYSYAGDFIFFTSDGYIYKMHIDGTNKTKLTKGNSPIMTPDGSKIIYLSEVNSYDHIFSMDKSGSNINQLTSGMNNNHFQDISQNSNQIIFNSDRDGDFDIYIMNVNGTAIDMIYNSENFDSHPKFQPR